ncbi:unnamed protein product [Paramecium pentaurelia]|uniref:Uncharacterized protein n=1 Tax=Paramecium pentaurelia TaxID=43138 RepID=A0A8S1S485_9CILI|nr:unnamed protein product [Paramecium pentaurelia]
MQEFQRMHQYWQKVVLQIQQHVLIKGDREKIINCMITNYKTVKCFNYSNAKEDSICKQRTFIICKIRKRQILANMKGKKLVLATDASQKSHYLIRSLHIQKIPKRVEIMIAKISLIQYQKFWVNQKLLKKNANIIQEPVTIHLRFYYQEQVRKHIVNYQNLIMLNISSFKNYDVTNATIKVTSYDALKDTTHIWENKYSTLGASTSYDGISKNVLDNLFGPENGKEDTQ